MTRRYLSLAVLSLLLVSVTAQAQSTRADGGLGMVWEKPEDPIRAAADLRAMADLGVTGVRTSVWEDPMIFDLADTLGIRVYQEVSIHFAPASALADTVDYIRNVVGRIAAAGRVRGVGLAYAPETSDPSTCALLGDVAASAAGRIETYVVSVFDPARSCRESVDFVLYTQLSASPEDDVHLAEFGAAGIADGLLQSDFFADRLPDRLAMNRWTFVARWTDAASPSDFAATPATSTWGLHSIDGTPRPAVSIIAGAAMRGQRVFPRGVPPPSDRPAYRYVLAGWVVLLVILLAYARSPRLRSMYSRYFAAHGIYRMAVGDNRDRMIGSNLTLLACMSLLFGMVTDQAIRSYSDHRVYAAIWHWAAPNTRSTLDALIASPLLLTSSVALLALLGVGIWIAAWFLAAGRPNGASWSQAIILSVWPRWPVFATLPVVMLIAAGSWGDLAARVSVVWVLVTGAWSTVRTNLDAAAVLRMRAVSVGLLWATTPFVPLAVLGLFLWARFGPEIGFLRTMILLW